eukprot:ANDGO_03765.mRNA.1 V-type proton ATPase subunit G
MDNKSVQKLLAAEQEANTVVSEAKKARIALLKRAKTEAEAEIQKFKQEMENQFRQKHASDLNSRDQYRIQLERQTDIELEQVKRIDPAKKRTVSDFLLSKVQDVHVAAPLII